MLFRSHVNFADGTTDEAKGDPEVRDDVLYVTVHGPGRATLLFQVAYPLRHVKSWWVDYEAEEVDASRMPAGLDDD